ncbi:MAG: hypothetical protein OES38_05790 [Gammaproteobacteria bacterium]|nr:hypothetical protein [Gammaproteobacteria bacterium]
MSTDDPHLQELDALPESLVDALRSADRPPALITSRVDREIADLAAGQFAGRGGGARRSRPARVGMVAMAASVLIAVAALLSVFRGPDPERGSIYADIDGSGRIDIADVRALARDVGSNGVSRAEIEAFAARVVELDRGGDAT